MLLKTVYASKARKWCLGGTGRPRGLIISRCLCSLTTVLKTALTIAGFCREVSLKAPPCPESKSLKSLFLLKSTPQYLQVSSSISRHRNSPADTRARSSMGPPPRCELKVPHADTNPQWDAIWRWAVGRGGESAMRMDLHDEISALGRKDTRDSLCLPCEDMVRHPRLKSLHQTQKLPAPGLRLPRTVRQNVDRGAWWTTVSRVAKSWM